VRITLTNWNEIYIKKLRVNPETSSVSFLDSKLFSVNYELTDIFSIERETGSKALYYSLVGGAIGILGFYTIYRISDWDDPYNEVNSMTIGSTFFLCTGIGLGVGFAIGRTKKKYKPIYEKGQFISE